MLHIHTVHSIGKAAAYASYAADRPRSLDTCTKGNKFLNIASGLESVSSLPGPMKLGVMVKIEFTLNFSIWSVGIKFDALNSKLFLGLLHSKKRLNLKKPKITGGPLPKSNMITLILWQEWPNFGASNSGKESKKPHCHWVTSMLGCVEEPKKYFIDFQYFSGW